MKSLKKKRKGFTLIELLVVIAIIGTLATIVMVSLNTARSKARDTRRAADLRSISLALEMYYDANGAYPATASLAAIVTAGYLPSLPTDPQVITQNYAYAGCTNTYTLGAKLENNNANLLANDIDSDSHCDLAATAIPPDCADTATNFYYCLKP